MKKSSCDCCGDEIGFNDMHDGELRLGEYHDAHLHLGHITIKFDKHYQMIDQPPDLCLNCLSKKLTAIIAKERK